MPHPLLLRAKAVGGWRVLALVCGTSSSLAARLVESRPLSIARRRARQPSQGENAACAARRAEKRQRAAQSVELRAKEQRDYGQMRADDEARATTRLQVLITYIRNPIPLSEGDAMRALACRALVGLVRCDSVRQIVSRLPLIANNELTC